MVRPEGGPHLRGSQTVTSFTQPLGCQVFRNEFLTSLHIATRFPGGICLVISFPQNKKLLSSIAPSVSKNPFHFKLFISLLS